MKKGYIDSRSNPVKSGKYVLKGMLALLAVKPNTKQVTVRVADLPELYMREIASYFGKCYGYKFLTITDLTDRYPDMDEPSKSEFLKLAEWLVKHNAKVKLPPPVKAGRTFLVPVTRLLLLKTALTLLGCSYMVNGIRNGLAFVQVSPADRKARLLVMEASKPL